MVASYIQVVRRSELHKRMSFGGSMDVIKPNYQPVS